MYPLTGNVTAHVGGVQASLLTGQRLLYRLHRAGLAWGTSGTGALCARFPMPVMKKSQVPVADDPARARDVAAHGVQPDRSVVRALGVASRASGRGRELRLPAVAQAQLLPPVIRALHTPALRFCALLLVGVAGMLVSAGPASAEDAQSGNADLARRLADDVVAGQGAEPLGAWSQSVIERALERAVAPEGTSPLPRDRDAVAAAPNGATAEVLLFTSLAVPAASWRAAARDAARIDAPLVLRGVAGGSLPETARQIAGRLGDAKAGVAIDPRLFRLFGITRVPAVVVVPGGVPPCRSHGCADDAPPPFDRVSGNLSLAAALEAVAAEGGEGRAAARRHLATLRGTRQ